jgi:hypothetical protein
MGCAQSGTWTAKVLVVVLGGLSMACCTSHALTVGNADADAATFGPEGYAIEITSVNGLARYSHQFVIASDCQGRLWGTGRYTGSESSSATTETVSDIVLDQGVLKFKASYDWTEYVWYPAFVLHDDGALSFQDGYGPDNVLDAIGSWSPSIRGGCGR